MVKESKKEREKNVLKVRSLHFQEPGSGHVGNQRETVTWAESHSSQGRITIGAGLTFSH